MRRLSSPRCRGARTGGPAPQSHMLVARCLVVSDERDLRDVDAEEVETARLRPPAQGPCRRLGVAALRLRVGPGPNQTADFQLTFAAVATGDNAVHQHARIAVEIGRLPRAQHHRQPQLAVYDQRLHRAEPVVCRRGGLSPPEPHRERAVAAPPAPRALVAVVPNRTNP